MTTKNRNLDDYYRAQLDAEEDAATSNEEVTTPLLHRADPTATTTEMIEIVEVVDLDSGEIRQESFTKLDKVTKLAPDMTEAEFQTALKEVLIERNQMEDLPTREKSPKIVKIKLCAAQMPCDNVLDFSDVVLDMINDVDIGIEVEHVELDIQGSILGANYMDDQGCCRGGFILQTDEEAWALNGAVCLNALASMLITITREHHPERFIELTADSEKSQEQFAEAVRKIQEHAGIEGAGTVDQTAPLTEVFGDDTSPEGDE